eukprot:1152731-Pyramimonas_sp.AAC.2
MDLEVQPIPRKVIASAYKRWVLEEVEEGVGAHAWRRRPRARSTGSRGAHGYGKYESSFSS